MITAIVVGWGEGADCYSAGRNHVTEIRESTYQSGDSTLPCFVVSVDDGSTIEIRQTGNCNIHRSGATVEAVG